MKKVKNQKNNILRHPRGPQRNLKQLFFGANSKSKSLPAYTVHTLANIEWYVHGSNKKKKIYFNPQVP